MRQMNMNRLCRCIAVIILLAISRLTVSAGQGQASHQVLRVDETALQLHLLPQAELELPLVSTSGKPLEGDLTIQLADFSGNVSFSQTAQIEAEPGATVKKIALQREHLVAQSQSAVAQSPSALGWNLLSYSIRPRSGSVFPTVQGIVQAALVIKDSFELRL